MIKHEAILKKLSVGGNITGVENSIRPLVIYECHGYKDEIRFQFTRPVGRLAMLQVPTYLSAQLLR